MIKNKAQKGRFISVGIINTALDFGVLFGLKALGLPAIPANIISTTAAFCFSFFANKKYTFKSASSNVKRELLLFLVITLFGLWVLQSAVIYITSILLTPLALSTDVSLLIAKLAATFVSLTWNYVLYSRVVFKKESE